MSNIKKLFGLRIKELREQKGLNQEQLAELIDFESRHLSRIETGKSFTTIENIEKIASALNVDIDSLFKFKHEKESSVLKKEIFDIVNNADKDRIRLIYKLLIAISN